MGGTKNTPSRKEPAMSIASDLIRDIEAETKKTRAMLAVVPDGRLDWKPHEKSMTLGALASHLAENPSWISAMLEDEMDFAAMKDYRPFEGKNRAELLAALERNVRAGTEAIRGRSDGFLAANWTMRNGPKVLMSAPKHE